MTASCTILAVAAVALALGCDAPHQASAAGEVGTPENHELAQAIASQSDLRDAESQIEGGHPWRATQSLAPLLKNPSKRTPAVLVVAARAAAGWDGWTEVDKLLARETWIDTSFDGEGRELLARSALERNTDTLALTHARASVRDAKSNAVRAPRLVFLARAFERTNQFDSAAASYRKAGESLRLIRDWLALRTAGTTVDSAERQRLFVVLTLPQARSRVGWTEAQTRERFADLPGAASRYLALGATVTALKLRLSASPVNDTSTRNAIKAQLVDYIRSHNGTADSRNAADLIDKTFASNTPTEELTFARSLAISGPAVRAVTAFERAQGQPAIVTPNDHLLYAQALARASRTRDALAQFASIDAPSNLAAAAAYQRSRLLMTSSSGEATRASLRDVVARFPNDTSSAAAALYLLADLSTDDANDQQARAFYQQLYRSYPTSARAADARFNAAIISLAHDSAKAAALAFDSLSTLLPRSDEAIASKYWSGRAWAEAGNKALAQTRWREVTAPVGVSYYATVAAKQLGTRPWVPPARTDSFPRFAAVDSGLARAALLERLGMDVEAKFEYDALDESAAASPDRLLATAHAFLEHNQSWRAIRLAQKLIESGQRDARAYRLLYPVVDLDELTRTAKANDLDPALVAGIIRQESNFNPRALSVAGARGLMQVLPSVGEEVSRGLRYPAWYPSLLFDADANLQLGTAHLAAYMKQYGPIPRVLAAYNAGGSRVTRWVNRAGTDDPQLFAERIPFAETRDYVRIVQRNAELYRALYSW
jgi:soluble lytic murein transglycosylase